VPIQIGDLVKYQNSHWLVSQRHRGVRTVILRQLDGTAREVANDDPSCEVLAHLPTQWPFITIPKKASAIESITVTRDSRNLLLKPMQAWVPADPLHNGGVLYFNPKINLRQGEVLVARHVNGTLTRVNVTASYGTAQRKLLIEEAKKPGEAPQTRYDHLLMEDDDDV
jgi:hypothetical protein